MDITCNSSINGCQTAPCPIILDSDCVFYEGANLLYIGVSNNDSLQTALQKINTIFRDTQKLYIFSNGIVQSGYSIKLGGSLLNDTNITGNYKLTFEGSLSSDSLITNNITAVNSLKYSHSTKGIGKFLQDSDGLGNANWSFISFSSLTNKPTTVAGYGITDPIVVTSGSYSDPTWLTLSKTKVGLTNVDNTSDVNKPISIDTQNALDGKINGNNNYNGAYGIFVRKREYGPPIPPLYTPSPFWYNKFVDINDVLSQISQEDAIGILGYTPYNSTNPDEYISNISNISAGGELSGFYPNPTILNSAILSKNLTGLSVTGTVINPSDTIITAFGKLQNQYNSLVGGMNYQGVWNASTNTPTFTSGVGIKGYTYKINVAGSTAIDGINDWKIGDFIVFNGTTWDKWDTTDQVSNVNGFTGNVVLTSNNVAENTNLYFTTARARTSLSFVSGSGAYDNSTGVITIPTNTNQLTNGAGFITGLSFAALTGKPTTLSGYSITDAQPLDGDLTSIAGLVGTTGLLRKTAADSWTLDTNSYLTGITGSQVTTALGFTPYNSSNPSGYISSVPAQSFASLTGKPTTLSGYGITDPVISTANISGTTNYVSKFTGTNSLGNSQIFDNGTNVGIGTTNPYSKIQISGFGLANGLILGERPDFPNGIYGALYSTATGNGVVTLEAGKSTIGYGTVALQPNGGFVGIGTTTPVGMMDVRGTGYFWDGTGTKTRIRTGGIIDFTNVAEDAYSNALFYASQFSFGISNKFLFGTQTDDGTFAQFAGNVKMKSDACVIGNFGVGIASSTMRMNVFSTGYAAHFGEGSASAGIDIRNRLATLPTTGTVATIAWMESTSGVPAGSLLLGSRPGVGGVILSATGSNDLYVHPNGKVGIGISAPTSKLHVRNGGIKIEANSSFEASIILQDLNTGGNLFYIGPGVGTGSPNGFSLLYNASTTSNIIYATNTGNVGIGTTSPRSPLHLHSTNDNSIFSLTDATLGQNYGGYIKGYGVVGSGGRLDFGVIDNNVYRAGITIDENATFIRFKTNLSGTLSEKMVINNYGNVGIGTTSPTLKLEVNNTTVGEQCSLGIVGDSIPNITNLSSKWYGVVNNSIKFHRGGDATGGEISFWTTTSSSTPVLSERIRITSTGNVGIGTTNPTSTLDIRGTTHISDGANTKTRLRTGGIIDFTNFAESAYANSSFVSSQFSFMGGNFGINTDTPSYQLSINGITNTNQLIVNSTVNNGNQFQVTGNTTINGILSVGSSSPTRSKFFLSDVNRSVNSTLYNFFVSTSDAQGADIGGQIGLGGQIGNGDNNAFGVISGRKDNATSGSYAGYISLATTDGGGTTTEKVRVTSLGKVGIGTTNPTSKLQVVGLPVYENNTLALAGGLTAGAFYRTSIGVLMVAF